MCGKRWEEVCGVVFLRSRPTGDEAKTRALAFLKSRPHRRLGEDAGVHLPAVGALAGAARAASPARHERTPDRRWPIPRAPLRERR